MTVFIPCGVTQAMEVNAIAVANPIQSSALMFAFVLGTVPLFSIKSKDL
jgi:sulfite exporter TauE/SafE